LRVPENSGLNKHSAGPRAGAMLYCGEFTC
jgi:hypothetical protein